LAASGRSAPASARRLMPVIHSGVTACARLFARPTWAYEGRWCGRLCRAPPTNVRPPRTWYRAIWRKATSCARGGRKGELAGPICGRPMRTIVRLHHWPDRIRNDPPPAYQKTHHRLQVAPGRPTRTCCGVADWLGHRACIAARANTQFPRTQPTTSEAQQFGGGPMRPKRSWLRVPDFGGTPGLRKAGPTGGLKSCVASENSGLVVAVL
jgi:hypothetical protein